jgi:hypothetical protein
MNKEQAQKIDKILNLLGPQKNFSAYDISLELDMPEEEAQYYMDLLCFNIKHNGVNVVDYASGKDVVNLLIIWNKTTPMFIESGGAVGLYNDLLAEMKKEEARQKLEDIKLQNEVNSFRLKKWQYIVTTGIAVLALILSAINYFWPNT